MSENKRTDESRRGFLKAGGLAAAGIILTPIAVACGGEDDGGKSKPKPRSGGGKKPNNNKGNGGQNANNSNNGGGGSSNLVDKAADLGDKGTAVLSAYAAAAWTPSFMTIDTEQEKVERAWKDRFEGKVPDESKNYTNKKAVGGKHAVANVLFKLTPKDANTKLLKYSNDAVGLNQDFRFTRVLVCGVDKKISFKIYDGVNHNVTVKQSGAEVMNESKTSDKGELVSSGPLWEGDYALNCSMHKWEMGYIYCMPHAAFGVTGCDLDRSDIKDHGTARTHDGKAVIPNLAVGKYNVDVIYEGSKKGSFEIEVTKDGTAEHTFDF